MSRKKLKALTFGDYGITLLASVLGFLALSWMFNFSWGPVVYSILMTLILFLFIYSRGALAAKIDTRTGEANLKKAMELIMPLALTMICIIAIYSLFYYDILPANNVVIKSGVAEDGTTVSLYAMDIIAVVIRILFLNLTGFMFKTGVNPFILLVSPLTIAAAALCGYYFGMRKIFISEYIIKFKDFVVQKFNE